MRAFLSRLLHRLRGGAGTAEAPGTPGTPLALQGGMAQDATVARPGAATGMVPFDENLLERARTQWQFGDWASLAALSRETLQHHPDRAKLALLAAAGHQQVGDGAATAAWVKQAKEWGCDPKLLARLLVAGVHNTLGRAAAASRQEARALKHFAASVKGTGGDERLLSQARSVREVTRLGLLEQAAERIKKEVDALPVAGLASGSGRADPQIMVLKTSLEIVQHELSLAHQRNQLNQRLPEAALSAALESSNLPPGPENPAWLEALKRKSVAQLGQDLWVLERTGYKRGGYFVEFGATDGVLLSNSYLLEMEFGWRGICAEPNPKMFEKLKRNRRCSVSEACVGPRSGEVVDFVLAEEYGGMVRDMTHDMHVEKREAYHAHEQYRAQFVTTSLHDLLTGLGAPREIDYLSIDTEGSELSILSAFPFEHWNVRLMSVEHNFTPARQQIAELLASKGYVRTEAKWDDWYEKRPPAVEVGTS